MLSVLRLFAFTVMVRLEQVRPIGAILRDMMLAWGQGAFPPDGRGVSLFRYEDWETLRGELRGEFARLSDALAAVRNREYRDEEYAEGVVRELIDEAGRMGAAARRSLRFNQLLRAVRRLRREEEEDEEEQAAAVPRQPPNRAAPAATHSRAKGTKKKTKKATATKKKAKPKNKAPVKRSVR